MPRTKVDWIDAVTTSAAHVDLGTFGIKLYVELVLEKPRRWRWIVCTLTGQAAEGQRMTRQGAKKNAEQVATDWEAEHATQAREAV